MGVIDREKHDSITLTVVASDNGTPRKSSSALVYVDILDFNDNAPKFIESNVSFNVTEGCYNETDFVKINATDADQNENAQILFEIVQQTNFSIDTNTVSIFTYVMDKS